MSLIQKTHNTQEMTAITMLLNKYFTCQSFDIFGLPRKGLREWITPDDLPYISDKAMVQINFLTNEVSLLEFTDDLASDEEEDNDDGYPEGGILTKA